MTSRKLGLALALALAAGTALADPSPAKKALIDKIVALQMHGLADGMANGLVQAPLSQLTQPLRAAVQQVPAEKREATGKALETELKKFVDENVPYLKDKITKAAPGTASALLDERFNEDELKQILAWAESPVSQKFGAANAEMQKAIVQKVMSEVGPTMDGRFKTLQASLGKQLGVVQPSAGGAAKPAASAAPKK